MSSSLQFASTSCPNRLSRLLKLPLSRCIVEYTIELTMDVVKHGLGRSHNSPRNARVTVHSKFRKFVDTVIHRAEVTVPMLLAAAVYFNRAKQFIHISQLDFAYERVFLGALVVATKYHNDKSLKNNHWAVATGLFSPRDVSRIEREMLDVLNYELRIEEKELLIHEVPLLTAMVSPDGRNTLWIHSLTGADDDPEAEASRWSDSDSDNTPSLCSEDSLPMTPLTPLLVFPLPPPTFRNQKRDSYPPLLIPAPIRTSLSF